MMTSKKWVYFDVDDTLLIWPTKVDKYPDLPKISVENPYYSDSPYSTHPKYIPLQIHTTHLENLKEHHTNGDIIVVWSRGGKQWADAAVDALGIRDMVYCTLTKPDITYDDEPYKNWLPHLPRWREPK